MSVKIPECIEDFFDQDQVPLVLSDARIPDNPLISINNAFCEMSGFHAGDILGANCRFMQGDATQKSSLNTIRGDFASKSDTCVLIRNYRNSGEAFDNFLYIFTIFSEEGEPVFRLGSQFEIPETQRAKAFEDHLNLLGAGLGKINQSGALPQHHLINLAPLKAMSADTLLTSRLDNLRAA